MNRKLLWILGGIVAVILIVLIALPFLFDVNRFRPEIQSRLSQSLGRDVKIGGLTLSLFSGGIKADNISIADDPAFSKAAFIEAKSFSVGVQLKPLIFDKQIRVESLLLNDPTVRLIQNSAGKWNFSTLGQKNAKSTEGGQTDLQVNKLEISNGRLELGTVNQPPKAYTDVQVKVSDFSYNSQFPYSVSAVAPGGGKLNVEGKAGPIDRADSSRTPFSGDVTVKNLDLASSGFMPPGSPIGGLLDYKGTVKSDGKKIDSSGTADIAKLRLVKGATAAAQPIQINYNSDYDVAREQGSIRETTIKTGKSTAQLGGTFASRGAFTDLALKFTGKQIGVEDLEKLLPAAGITLPAGSNLQGGNVAANLNLNGPTNKLVTTGNIDLSNARLAGFSLGKNLSTIATLAGIKAGSDTTIQTFSSNLKIGPEGTRADNLNLVVPDLGTITGNGVISPEGALDFHLLAKLANGGGAVGALTQLAGLKGGGLKNIPVAVKGTTAKPVFMPDVGSALAGSGGSQGLLGGATAGQDQQQQQNPLGGIIGGLFGAKKKK